MSLSVVSESTMRRLSIDNKKGGGVLAFLETRLQVILLLVLLCLQEKLLQRIVPVGEGVSIHSTHVVNVIHPYLSWVLDQQVSLLL